MKNKNIHVPLNDRFLAWDNDIFESDGVNNVCGHKTFPIPTCTIYLTFNY